MFWLVGWLVGFFWCFFFEALVNYLCQVLHNCESMITFSAQQQTCHILEEKWWTGLPTLLSSGKLCKNKMESHAQCQV